MKKLALIDGNSLFNRAFYATPVFTTKSGMPTNAIFGFVKLLFKIMSDLEPDYILCAFDMTAPTFRHEMYDEYKATRKGMPEPLQEQVQPLKALLAAMNIAMCQQEGIEADDILGTISKRMEGDVHSYIYTGDRDSFQLVDEKTDVCFTVKGVSELRALSAENFVAEIGVEPKQIIDMKALMGDTSDNIPGVAGIGEKTAKGLIQKYGSLDGVYENIDDIKGAMHNKLVAGRDSAYLSYTLSTIRRDCDVEIDLEKCVTPKKYGQDVKELFMEYEFKSLLAMPIFETADEGDPNAHPAGWYPENTDCRTLKEYMSARSHMQTFVDIRPQIIRIYDGRRQFTYQLKTSIYDTETSDEQQFAEVLSYLFTGAAPDSGSPLIVYDYKAALHILGDYGITPTVCVDDLALMKYLCDYAPISGTLDDLCMKNDLKPDFSAYAISVLYGEYRAKLNEDEDLLKLYNDVEKPLTSVLYNMESKGVMVSPEILDVMKQRYNEVVNDLRSSIYDQCGTVFNINSPSQLGEVLYNKFNITELKKKTTGKFTTNAEMLEKYEDQYPVIKDVLRYRFYQKLISTYLDGMKPFIGPDRVVHTTYNQMATSTGRLSSSDPNLQNIPVRDEEGKEIRRMFVPRPGCVFVDADYSQIELRLLAHCSGCKELIDAYNEGRDIHTLTASQVFGVPMEQVTPDMRRHAKAVNFGIIYGISEYGLSKNIGVSVADARKYISRYFEMYSAVKEYMDSNVKYAKENGYVKTLTGRKRAIPELKSGNYGLRQFGERAAMNMPLQGSSADIIKIAMNRVSARLKAEGVNAVLLLQVHDELMLEAKEEDAERAGIILREEMEHAMDLRVPLTVEVHTGYNWFELK